MTPDEGAAPASILVLEDEAVVALELETRLAKLGYRVLGPVSSAAEAFRLASEERPSLLLADVRIVGPEDGIEVATELRRRFDVPTVFLTAHSDSNTLRRIVAASPFGYLTKPFREAELHGTIETALVRARLERELADRERRLRDAYRIGNLGHWEIDPARRRATVSPEVYRLLGIHERADAAELLERLLERIVSDDRCRVRANFERAGAGGLAHWTDTFRAIHPTLGVRHFRAYGEVRGVPADPAYRIVGVLQDITALELAAAAARERHERARITYEVSGDGEWEWYPSSNRVAFSPRWKAMLGYDDTEPDDALGQWEGRVHPEDIEAARTLLDDHLHGRSPVYVSEHRVRGKYGQYVHILDRGKVVEWDEQGRPQRMIGIITDVSELRSAERRAHDAQHRYRRLFEQAAVGVAEVDAVSFEVLRANDRFASILGLTTGALEGAKLTAFTHPDDAEAELAALARLSRRDTSEVTLEKRAIDARGEVRWIRETLSPLAVTRGADSCVVCVTEDVTGRRVAEEERERVRSSLERTTRELEAMLAAFPDALVRLDRHGRVLHVRLGHQSTGNSALRALTSGSSLEDIASGEELGVLREALCAAVRDRVVAHAEFDMEGRDGARSFEGRIVPAETDEALLILRDITERREADRTLRAREEQLRHAQRLESVGRLAGGVAHDFNSLLSVIVCTGALLEPKVASDLDSVALVRDILDASERASALTQQLLAFSRKQVTAPRPVDVNERILSFARLMERTLGGSITLLLRLCPAPAVVLVDPGQLEQMLLNLVVNARDAMPEGGRLEIWTAVDSRGDGGPGTVRVRVRDEGMGIEPAVLPSIFEPFFTTKEVGRGTGLGLATVHGIVQQAGGQIDVSSQIGRGTTFEIRLPATLSTSPSLETRQSEPVPARGEHILVVDDEPAVRRLTSQLLERAGYRVSEAAGGFEALGHFRDAEPRVDALVVDLIMPRLGGLALAREVRRGAPRLPILFLSGFGDDAGAARTLGTVLVKPYTPERLYLAVQRLLAASRAAAERAASRAAGSGAPAASVATGRLPPIVAKPGPDS